jgi:hypothetical protein
LIRAGLTGAAFEFPVGVSELVRVTSLRRAAPRLMREAVRHFLAAVVDDVRGPAASIYFLNTKITAM